MNRHLSRSVVLQTLFEIDFNERDSKDARAILLHNTHEFAPGTADTAFTEALLDNVLAKRMELDAIIEKAAPEWPIDRISVIDRNVLRLGLYELLFADRAEVPAKVAINEAIELAKAFGGEKSGGFVNGVLGAVYKEIGEPGKNDKGKRVHKKIDVPYEKMPVEKLVGAVVFARDKGEVYLALIHDIFGHWTLSKGHIETNEDPGTGIVRKIKEELGLDITVVETLGENEYIATDPEKGKIRKHVSYFLAESLFSDIHLAEKGGLDDAKWFKLSAILDLNFYEDILPIVTKAINRLVQTDTP